MKRRRRPIPLALSGHLGDLERYGLLALVAALVLGVAWLARAFAGDASPFEVIGFAPTADLSSEREGRVGCVVDAPGGGEQAPPRVESEKLARATSIEPVARPAARSEFDFFEPPVRLPGRPPVVVPPLPGSDEGAVRKLVVRKGDTLQKIAARELGDAGRWRTLLQWNAGLDPKKLKPGQELKLPLPAREAPAAVVPAATRTHEVAKDETLQSLAERYYGERARWIDLLEANRDQLREPSALRVGMKIRIP